MGDPNSRRSSRRLTSKVADRDLLLNIQRNVFKPANLTDVDTFEHRVTNFGERNNATATAFDWRYTKDD